MSRTRTPAAEVAAACRREDAGALRRLRTGGVEAAVFDAALWDACKDGDVRAVRCLLDAGAEVDQAHEREGSLLTVTFLEGLHHRCSEIAEILDLLMDRKPALEVRDESGQTVLMHAAMHRYGPFFDRLLDQGADVEARDHRDVTALMDAADSGCAEAVAALVACGADLERREKQGRTALVYACAQRQGRSYRAIDASVAALLEAGADMEAVDRHGCRAVDYDSGEARVVLDRHAVESSGLSRADRSLFAAALDDDGRAVRAALAAGAQLDATDALGRTAHDVACDLTNARAALALVRARITDARLPANEARLLRAAIRGDVHSLRVALDRGAHPDTRGPDGEAVLVHACFFGKPAAARALLDAGARLDSEPARAALLWAVCRCDAELVARLLEAGAPTEHATRNGATPLFYAVGRREVAMVRSLLLAGARPRVVDHAGNRPGWYALSGDAISTEIRRLLDEAATGRLCATERGRGQASSFHDCSICSALPPFMHADLMKDESLPPTIARLENIWAQYHRCPECSTWYRYEHEYTYLAGGSEDDEAMSRLGPVEAMAALQEARKPLGEQAWQRERQALAERLDAVVEHLWGDVERDGEVGHFAIRALVSHALDRDEHGIGVTLLEHRSPRVRELAVHSVRGLDAPPFLAHLLTCLSDEDDEVVRAALCAFDDQAMVRAGGADLMQALGACPVDYYSVKVLWHASRSDIDLSPAQSLIQGLKAHFRAGRSVPYGRETLKAIDALARRGRAETRRKPEPSPE